MSTGVTADLPSIFSVLAELSRMSSRDTCGQSSQRMMNSCTSTTIPARQELGAAVPATAHIASLGFSPDCTLKPAPGTELVLQLMAHILQDGFVTAGKPLLVVQSRDPANFTNAVQLWSGDGGQPLGGACSLGYLKGMARATAALALLHRIFVLKVDLKSVHPVLHERMRAVSAHHVSGVEGR